jgi:hypothetical protein
MRKQYADEVVEKRRHNRELTCHLSLSPMPLRDVSKVPKNQDFNGKALRHPDRIEKVP